MPYNHVLLEVYCSYGTNDEANEIVPEFCPSVTEPGYHCLENNCKHCGHTYADYEIAYADKQGLVPDADFWIGFGGNMQPEVYDEEKIKNLKELWKEICKQKISEAYEEYMSKSGRLKNT
ncbi:hypothetical protein [Paenibacillus glycanilyticus]|uniref:Uncharacterized protein n=1 Tax=Paenibacillus glycanilyticus TaxID=126569 RepID=A0ABQ6GD88_9BACL|nr:hypothetical protein [Paenibacillus glycanilyticus]GLX67536.1 hypothetical protein MU1_18810 [Paenibacillus glycanilyticus]